MRHDSEPDILLLDEATSALDTHSEALVQVHFFIVFFLINRMRKILDECSVSRFVYVYSARTPGRGGSIA